MGHAAEASGMTCPLREVTQEYHFFVLLFTSVFFVLDFSSALMAAEHVQELHSSFHCSVLVEALSQEFHGIQRVGLVPLPPDA